MSQPESTTLKLADTHQPETDKLVLRSGAKARTIVAPSILRRENISALIFPKVDIGTGQAPPGTWYKADGDAVMVCPMCGTRHAIDLSKDGYRIDARGVLYPSVLCTSNSCTFDRYCLLQGWAGMGKLGRKKDNDRGIILYCLAWRKRMVVNGHLGYYLQPFEYCDAVSYENAVLTWRLFIDQIKANGGFVVGISPSIDPHVSGDGDPRDSILSGKGV